MGKAKNCFTLCEDGTIKEGIPCEPRCIRLTTSLEEGTLPFEASFNCQSDRLLRAAPTADKTALQGIKGWPGALLQLHTRSLQFPEHLSTPIRLSNFWPGAETNGRLLLQVGSRQVVDQAQLLALYPNNITLVADRDGRYIRIRWNGRCFTLTAPTKAEFADLLIKRAETHLRTYSALRWTKAAVTEMGFGHTWTTDLTLKMQRASKS